MLRDLSGQEIRLGIEALSRFMPMHLLLDAKDRILSVGPTLQRVLEGIPTLGARFEDLFEVRAPGGAVKISDVLDRAANRFRLAPRHKRNVTLRGLGQRMEPDGPVTSTA